MKKILVMVILLFGVVISVNAQKGNNQIEIAAEIGFPNGHFDNDFNTGYGGSVKGLWGMGKTGQLTFTNGYMYFKSKGDLYQNNARSVIIPFLAGFRLLKNGFYAEPQLGLGLYRIKLKGYYAQNATETDAAFTYAFGIGYTKSGVDVGVRYQGANKGSDDITIIGIHLGYAISFKNNH